MVPQICYYMVNIITGAKREDVLGLLRNPTVAQSKPASSRARLPWNLPAEGWKSRGSLDRSLYEGPIAELLSSSSRWLR
jgi:hypothetical protein